MTTRAKDLPFDVIYQILYRLPVKSLLRFRCISKLCRETIDDPMFIRTHHHRASHTLLFGSDTSHTYQLEDYHGELRRVTMASRRKCPVICRNTQFVCSAQGFLLFLLHQEGKVYLCNPSRRESISLPPYKRSLDFVSYGSIEWLGMGFDSSMNEYKIVLTCHEPLENAVADADALIYSSKTKSWKKTTSIPIDLSNRRNNRPMPHGAFFFNGSIHWIHYSSKSRHGFNLLLFDMKTEEFSLVEVDIDISCEAAAWSYFLPGRYLALMELGGYLGIVSRSMICGYKVWEKVWILAEGKWKAVDIENNIHDQDTALEAIESKYRAHYNVEEQRFKWTSSRKLINKNIRRVFRCKETLLSAYNF